MIPFRKVGDIVVCPRCGNKFKYTDDHKYVWSNEFVCSWGCFTGKDISVTKKEIVVEQTPTPIKKKRGRPRKGEMYHEERNYLF